MTTPASYDAIASLYDQHWGQEFASFAQEAFEKHLAKSLPGGAAILDLCCGTGLLIAHLAELGYSVFGVDESAGMLEIAARNSPIARLQQADMAGFQWDQRFDAVVCLYNSVNHTHSTDHFRAVLIHVAAHLRPQGLFLFDYAAREAFESAWESDEEIDAEDGWAATRYTYERSAGRALCAIDRRTEIRQISLDRELVHDALHHAGLALIQEIPMAGPRPVEGRHLILARALPRQPS
jgi:SAM-dependent methyltransferase